MGEFLGGLGGVGSCGIGGVGGAFTNTGTILVLFILLVIVSCAFI